METGLTQTQVDEMDIIRNIKLLSRKRSEQKANKQKERLTIDQVLG